MELSDDLRRMREDWDRRARENARYYIATGREEWSDEEFFASGQAEVDEQILNDMENICQERDPKQMRVLEIGCGAGRVTRALAGVFGEVHAVDVSGEMVARARDALREVPNVAVYQNNGMDLSVVPELPFDFAFSMLVMQHIPNRDVVQKYFEEAARLLKPGGLFKVQMLGRPAAPVAPPAPEAPPAELPLKWKLTGKIPLPIRQKVLRPIREMIAPLPTPPPPPPETPDTWIGVMYTPEDAAALADGAGFELRYQRGAGQEFYWLWCFKRPPQP